MEPTLPSKSRILTSKLLKDIKRNDIIIFNINPTKNYIKRVVGIPEENIQLIKDQIKISSRKEFEVFTSDLSNTHLGKFLTSQSEIKIPENSYFVLGDNKRESEDSRDIGLIKRSDILGKAVFILWPPKSFGLVKKAVPI